MDQDTKRTPVPKSDVISIQETLRSHFVSLSWRDKSYSETSGENRRSENDGAGRVMKVSGFVVSLDDNADGWLWITAGHILSDIENAKGSGQILEDFILDDYVNPAANYRGPNSVIPFDYNDAVRVFDDGDDGDYGFIVLRPNYVSLLKANGVRPIAAEHAVSLEHAPDFGSIWLAGIPSENVTTHRFQSIIRTRYDIVSVQLVRIVDLPESCRERHRSKTGEYFYGLLPSKEELDASGESLNDIDGFSGGPIIGVIHKTPRRFRYALLAVQSGWFPDKRIVYACGMSLLISKIRYAMSAWVLQNDEQSTHDLSLDKTTL